MAVERTTRPAATALGLFLALAVPLVLLTTGLLTRVFASVAPSNTAAGALLREGFFWVLTAIVLLVLTLGEKQKLSAIGFKAPRWSTLLWGLLATAAIYLAFPLGAFMYQAAGGKPPTAAINHLAALPIWVLGLTVLRAGVCEEILFRGYAIERMTALTGSRVIGIVVPALCFMFGHAGTFGPLYALQILPVTAILTALYVWRRDIWCNMLAHFLTDAFGLAPFVLAQHHH